MVVHLSEVARHSGLQAVLADKRLLMRADSQDALDLVKLSSAPVRGLHPDS